MADKKVSVNWENIRTLAKTFQAWSTDVDGVSQRAGLIELRPGSMTNGGLLRQRFADRTGQLKTKLTELQTMLYNTSSELLRIADVYEHTNNLQKDDLNRLTDLINAVGTTFPGVKDVIPPPVTPK